MGKIKRRKLRTGRYTPLEGNKSLKSSNTGTEESRNNDMLCEDDQPIKIKSDLNYASLNKGGLKLVKEKITSAVSEERLTGLNILASFALEENAAESLIKNNKIVTFVAPLLRDSNSQVRLAAAGTLRNLCLGGSDEAVDLIVRQNVLTPLSQLLKEYHDPPTPVENPKMQLDNEIALPGTEKDESNLIFIHATNLLWNLCECNEEALRVCNQEELVQVMLNHLDPYVWNFPVSMAAADCLLCISENNSSATSAILPQADSLVKLAFKSLSNNNDPAGMRFAVILSGILVNLNYWSPGGASFRQVFEVLSRALEVSPETIATQIESKSESSDNIEYLITAQLLALEIISNICCPEEEERWEECEEMSDDEDSKDSMNHDAIDASLVSPEVIEGIKYYELVPKILQKISFSKKNVNSTNGKENIEKLRLLEIRSLQCFQNLVSILDLSDLGGTNQLLSSWFQFGKILFTNAESDPLLLESSSGAMRAVMDKLTEGKTQTEINIGEEDLKQLFSAGSTCSVSAVRVNMSRMLGNLCCLLFQLPENAQADKVESVSNIIVAITDYLLKVSSSDEELFVQAEALDSVIDVFSDDKTDVIACKVRLVERLKEIQPEFRAKHNKNRKKLGDHRPLVVTVRDNLIAFIKYKGPRTSKLGLSSPSPMVQ